MWILIMTMIGYQGHAITVAEFTSKDKCLNAARQWMASVRAQPDAAVSLQPVTICAEK